MSTTTLCAFLNPDFTKFLAATKSTVSVFVHWHEHEYLDHETELEADADEGKIIAHGDGVLQISRKTYFNAMTEWLNEKTRYCAGGDFLGDGFIHFDELERMPMLVPVDAYLTSAETATKRVRVQQFGTTRDTDFYVEM